MVTSRFAWLLNANVRQTAVPVKLCFAKTPLGDEVVDLSALIQRDSPLDDHSPDGRHRQFALKNRAWRTSLAAYKKTVNRPKFPQQRSVLRRRTVEDELPALR